MNYTYRQFEDCDEKEINELAESGWELVTAYNSFFVKVPIFIFKKPTQDLVHI